MDGVSLFESYIIDRERGVMPPKGFEEVAKQAANSKKRLDQTAISVVKVTDDGKWFVKEIAYGRWDIRETAATPGPSSTARITA